MKVDLKQQHISFVKDLIISCTQIFIKYRVFTTNPINSTELIYLEKQSLNRRANKY